VSKTKEMTDAQVFKRATEKMKEYVNAGKYITYDQAEEIVKGESYVEKSYGSAFKDTLMNNLSSAFASITNQDLKNSLAQQFDQYIADNNVEAAVGVLNKAAYNAADAGQRTKIDGYTAGIELASTALNSLETEKNLNLGVFTTFANTALGELNISKDPVAARVKAQISNATEEIRKNIYGSQITAGEKEMLINGLPDLSKDTVQDAQIKLEEIQKALAVKRNVILEQYGGIDLYNSMGSVVNAYTNTEGARPIIDSLYQQNPNITPAEIMQDLQQVVGGDNKDVNLSAAQTEKSYKDLATNIAQNTFSTRAAQNVVNTYPQGATGGQCGVFAKTITDRDYSIGDSIESKKAAVNNKGIMFGDVDSINPFSNRKNWIPKVGQTIIFDNGTEYGHVAVVGDYDLATGNVTLIESNRNGNEEVTYDRTMNIHDKNNQLWQSAVGYLPTQLNASFTYKP
jgi:hypothetical protein